MPKGWSDAARAKSAAVRKAKARGKGSLEPGTRKAPSRVTIKSYIPKTTASNRRESYYKSKGLSDRAAQYRASQGNIPKKHGGQLIPAKGLGKYGGYIGTRKSASSEPGTRKSPKGVSTKGGNVKMSAGKKADGRKARSARIAKNKALKAAVHKRTGGRGKL